MNGHGGRLGNQTLPLKLHLRLLRFYPTFILFFLWFLDSVLIGIEKKKRNSLKSKRLFNNVTSVKEVKNYRKPKMPFC